MNSNSFFIDIHSHQNKTDELTIYNLPVDSDDVDKYSRVSVGIHPWYIDINKVEGELELLKKLAANKNVVAIGECGLDKLTEVSIAEQEQVFIKQIKIAEEVGKPMIIHCVKAFNELIRIKKEQKVAVPLIIHGFNNNKIIAKQLLDNGFYISFGKALLKEDSNASMIIKEFPMDKLFLETDDSIESIQVIYAAAARNTKMEMEKLKQQIVINYKKVFTNG